VPNLEEYILRILGEATEALFSSEIAERLNKELRPDRAYSTAEIVKHLKGMSGQVAQLPDGRWMLKRLML
jgi:repressor of nif and glnA expression